MLAWRKTSPQRSTPGPLPYQRPKTPWTRPSPRSSACWVPQSAVAARSSFSPGSNLTSAAVELACVAFIICEVDAAERRAAVAGGVAGGGEPRRLVARLLHQQHAHQRLDAAEQHGALGEVEAVGERDVVQGHVTSRRTCLGKYRSERLTNQANSVCGTPAPSDERCRRTACAMASGGRFRPASQETYGIAAGSAYIGGAESRTIAGTRWTGTSCESSMRWPTPAA